MLESHLTAAWISSATRLPAGEAVIYYRGSAQATSAEGEPWTGTVQGDILLLSVQQAIVIPEGTVTLEKQNSMKIAGPHRVAVAPSTGVSEWQHLLIP